MGWKRTHLRENVDGVVLQRRRVLDITIGYGVEEVLLCVSLKGRRTGQHLVHEHT